MITDKSVLLPCWERFSFLSTYKSINYSITRLPHHHWRSLKIWSITILHDYWQKHFVTLLRKIFRAVKHNHLMKLLKRILPTSHNFGNKQHFFSDKVWSRQWKHCKSGPLEGLKVLGRGDINMVSIICSPGWNRVKGSAKILCVCAGGGLVPTAL